VADEVFAVGTAAEITPVREIDDRKVGTGEPGPITRMLQDAYFDLVRGNSEDHNEWLAYIN
jgi:branched-chain amino acid aminotransferase